MVLQPAKEIFDKIHFSNYSDWKIYPTADYCCNKCHQVIAINFKNFENHAYSNFSNLSGADHELFKDFDRQANQNSFLDFYCPQCKRPVRIYFDAWAGGRHVEYGFTIMLVAH